MFQMLIAPYIARLHSNCCEVNLMLLPTIFYALSLYTLLCEFVYCHFLVRLPLIIGNSMKSYQLSLL